MGKTKGKLRSKLLQVTLIPLVLTCIIVMWITYFVFSDTVQKEVQRGLQNTASMTQKMLDHMYAGDYNLQEKEGYYYIYKGDVNLAENDSILKEIKEDSGIDITLFFGDTRVLTTLESEDGGSFVGTLAHSSVIEDVFMGQTPTFYEKVLVGETPYFAYYAPVYNGDGTCIGMIFAGKPSEIVHRDIGIAMLPIFIVLVFVVAIFCFICTSFTKELVTVFSSIKTFLNQIARGNLKAELDSRIMQRNDELGEMGRFTVHVQKFLREMIEKDLLTKLYSRRIGEVKLREVQKQAAETGASFCVVLGDIDHFKRFNDTYGHECGDKVLQDIADIVIKNMVGKGFAIRWGGEEFLLVYENTSIEKAYGHLEKLREEIRSFEILYEEERLHVTMTFGIAEGLKEEDISVSVKMADDLLYQGKASGRDRIMGVSL